MLLALGGVTLLVLVIGVVAVLRLAKTQQAAGDDETPPPSSDFVAPVSSGAFRFRKAEESAEGFHDRVNKESEEITSSRPGAKS